MPTYEFTCPKGHDFDKFFRSMASAPHEIPCPVCGEAAARKVSAGAGLVFKGSGFYITDYGKDGKKDEQKETKPDSSAAPEAKNASESKSDSGAGTGSSSGGGESEAKPPADAPNKSVGASKPASAATPAPAPAAPKSGE